MESNERLVLRLPSDLKAMFTALCESENITVSAKLKKMMANEIQQKLNRAMFHQTQLELIPRKQKKAPVSHSDNIQATTLPPINKKPLKASKVDLNELSKFANPLLSLVDDETEINIKQTVSNPVQSAINAQNRRKNKKKKR